MAQAGQISSILYVRIMVSAFISAPWKLARQDCQSYREVR